MRRYTLLTAVSALLVLVPWHTTVRAEPPTYTVVNLGKYGPDVPSIAGINASGEVVGTVNGSLAVRRFSGGTWEPVPGVGDIFSVATGINAAGDIVGYHYDSNFNLRAFRYNAGTNTVDDVAPGDGGTMTVGFAINQAGSIVGYTNSPSGIVAFRAAPGTPLEVLPALNGVFAMACGLNDAGQAAGSSLVNSSDVQHAMRVDNGALEAVDIVGFDGANGFSAACAIDGDGRVGGQATRSGQTHAFRFTAAEGMIDLDTFGSPASNVESIAAGLSVGWYTGADGVARAFAHRDADGSFDLNTRIDAPGWVLQLAKAVNTNGVIAGDGTLNGDAAAFLLTPAATADTTPPVIASVTADPASIFPPKGQSVPVALTVSASDDSGDAPVCTLVSITAPGALAGDYAITGALAGSVRAVGGRTYTFTVRCADAANNSASKSVDVTVTPDTTAPVIASATASPANLWPPDGRLVPVTVSVSVSDDVDAAPACVLTGVAGAPAGSGDATLTGGLGATLRAVGGRLYSLTVTCSDAAGNSSAAAATVVVPADTTAPVIASVTATPSRIWPPDGRLVPVMVSVSATDDVDARPSCALNSIRGGGLTDDAVITGPLSATLRAVGGRTYYLWVRCADVAGNASSKAATVVVPADTTAPEITSISASPASIWPANNKWVAVTVAVSATDDVDAGPVCSLTGISGGPASDYAITGQFSANVKAVRNGDGSVRTYLLEVSCHDKAGNTSLAAVTVSVSKDGLQKVFHYNPRLRQYLAGLRHAYGRYNR
jgi:probable HAF family extracellular repeat protein